jgi:hypothetical protein
VKVGHFLTVKTEHPHKGGRSICGVKVFGHGERLPRAIGTAQRRGFDSAVLRVCGCGLRVLCGRAIGVRRCR